MYFLMSMHARFCWRQCRKQGILKGGSINVPLTSCLTGLDWSVLQIKIKIVSCHTADTKPVKQEVNGTVILPPLVFPAVNYTDVIKPFQSARQELNYFEVASNVLSYLTTSNNCERKPDNQSNLKPREM
jgi:hypothetical protein